MRTQARPIDLHPFFYEEPQCGGLHDVAVWGPDLAGCFSASGVRLQRGSARLDISFVGASPETKRLLAEADGQTRINSFRGSAAALWSSARAHPAVNYTALYPGIDLVYGQNGGKLKSEYHVSAGADPSRIRLRYSGSVTIDSTGDLVIDTGQGVLREAAPVAWQQIRRKRQPIKVTFSLADDGTVGFDLGAYDRSEALVIDPVLTFSTVFGGSGSTINSVATDSQGNLYFAGCTEGTLSRIVSAVQSASRGRLEAFAGKLGPGGVLAYVTYLGGSGSDCATGVAVDSTGAAVITGWSTSLNFPVVTAFQPTLRGDRDGFVTRLGPQGDRIQFSTYLGGALQDTPNGVSVDGSGNIYIAGETLSVDFPVKAAVQPKPGGGVDAFLTELTSGGQMVYSTYYGGTLDDSAKAVAVTADGIAVIAGATLSSDLRTAGAFQTRSGGGQDAFLTQFGKQGTTLLFATYLGGSAGSPGAPEYASSVALDGSGAIYVTGVTSSSDFPVKSALWASSRGGIDAFVAKLAKNGASLIYSTYLGGTSVDLANAIAVDGSGNAYVGGATWSPNFPANGLVSARKYDYDAFITTLDAAGASLVSSVVVAGSASDAINSIAVDSTGSVYVGGQTASFDIPLLSPFGSPNGGLQGLLAVMSMSGAPAPLSVAPSSGSGYRQQFVVTSLAPAGAVTLTRTYIAFGSPDTTAMCYVVQVASNALYLLNDTRTDFLRGIVAGTADSIENQQCRIYAATSSVTVKGTVQTVTLDLYFKPAFAGPKTVVVLNEDHVGVFSPAKSLGTWTVLADPNATSLTPVSATPSSGSGSRQQFTITSTDPAGASDLFRTYVVFGAAGSQAACYLVYASPAGVYLLNDAMNAFLPGVVIGSNTSVENSYCRFNAVKSSVVNSGVTQTLTLDIEFKDAFAGAKTLSVLVETYGGMFGSKDLGSWTVPAGITLTPVSVNPSSGSDSSRQFTFTSTDPAGANDLLRTYVIFSDPGSKATCYVVHVAPAYLFLLDDTGLNFLRPLNVGTADSVENSNCRINAGSSSVVNNGTTQLLTLDLSFKSAFAGTKTVSAQVETRNNQFSGSRVLGTWTVPQ